MLCSVDDVISFLCQSYRTLINAGVPLRSVLCRWDALLRLTARVDNMAM